MNKISLILSEFDEANSNNFTKKIKDTEIKFKNLITEVPYIYDVSNNLISSFNTLNAYQSTQTSYLKDLSDKLTVIKKNAKTDSVINKSIKYNNEFVNNNKSFLDTLNKTNSFTNNELGMFTYIELLGLENEYKDLMSSYEDVLISKSNFLSYWEELQNQYYTIVSKHYFDKSTDYIHESNPHYKEWTETETYTDTETYTEREYVGSRIVGDKQENIYQTVTKTRPVTKTRTVTKNNGQPRTISVPYDVYKHYYVIDTYNESGKSSKNIYVGEKHEKYDYSLKTWNYKSNEQVGYVVWKQKWNDKEGILTGTHLRPVLE